MDEFQIIDEESYKIQGYFEATITNDYWVGFQYWIPQCLG